MLLENLHKEAPDAEVHYLKDPIYEWRCLYKKLDSSALKLSSRPTTHLVPEVVPGFIDAMPLPRVREVRLAGCFRNGREEHLNPGQGDFDFPSLFEALEGKGRPLYERLRLLAMTC